MRYIEVVEAGGPEQLRLTDTARPSPGPGEVLIRTRAIGVNRADCLQRRGLYPPPPGASHILGLEVAGEVAECGEGAGRFPEGAPVCALLSGGGYAEFVAVSEQFVFDQPPALDYLQGAAVPEVFATAWNALFLLGHVGAGDRVLIHAGASGVGTAAIQLACWRDARVLVTAGSQEKISRCLELGAQAGCNYREQSFAEFVQSETDGRGVDMILDVVGARYFQDNIDSLAIDGRLVVLGLQGGHRLEQVSMAGWLQKRLSIHGHTLRNHAARKRQVIAELEAEVVPALNRRELVPVIDRVFDWSEASAAHAHMEANRNIGKIVLAVT